MCVGSGVLGKEMVPGFGWPCRRMVLTLFSVPRAEWSMSHWVTVALKPGKTTFPEALPSQGKRKTHQRGRQRSNSTGMLG